MSYPENNGLLSSRAVIRDAGETISPDEPQCEAEAPAPMAAPDRMVIRDVKIKQLNFGYTVQVGCNSFAIETKEKLLTALGDYLNDPQGVEKKWFEGSFLK